MYQRGYGLKYINHPPQPEPCVNCKGTGSEEVGDEFYMQCSVCNGTGVRPAQPLPLWARVGIALLCGTSLCIVAWALYTVFTRS